MIQTYYSFDEQYGFTKIIFSLKIKYDMEEKYVNDVLVSGYAISKLNGAVQKESKTRRKNGYYEVETISDRVRISRANIVSRNSIPEIYYSKPSNTIKNIFPQYSQIICCLKNSRMIHLLCTRKMGKTDMSTMRKKDMQKKYISCAHMQNF